MKKTEFLAELRSRLASLPEEDVARSLAYYSEMIDDRTEDGMAEEDAVLAVGTPAEIAAQVLGDAPVGKQSKTKQKGKRAVRAWEIVLLILGAPLWISLLVTFAVLALACLIVLLAVVLSVWAVVLTVGLCALFVFVYGVFSAISGSIGGGIVLVGAGLCLAGIGIFLFLGCYFVTKGIWLLTKRIFRGRKARTV